MSGSVKAASTASAAKSEGGRRYAEGMEGAESKQRGRQKIAFKDGRGGAEGRCEIAMTRNTAIGGPSLHAPETTNRATAHYSNRVRATTRIGRTRPAHSPAHRKHRRARKALQPGAECPIWQVTPSLGATPYEAATQALSTPCAKFARRIRGLRGTTCPSTAGQTGREEAMAVGPA